ncbi:MAG: LuxR C-terminal-related transcriptional regulator [Bacteroidota bacterium]|nr:LuxR C-terminal-related transcriptional regulator [Bacteroidota bacterium]
MHKKAINQYLHSVSDKLSHREVVSKTFSDIKNFPLPIGKCFYIMDFKERTISFQRDVEKMLGYAPEEFTFELVANFFHPDDYDIVTRLMRATLMFATEHDVTCNVGFSLNYRVRHKNGNYMKVLRQSTIYQHDIEGKIVSNLSVLTDISFLNISNKVEWRFDAPGLDQQKFKEYVTKEYQSFFTDRELDIIRLLKQGLKSNDIAEKLHLSKHTVDTHRRKILKKSNCKNVVELLNFCSKNGLV